MAAWYRSTAGKKLLTWSALFALLSNGWWGGNFKHEHPPLQLASVPPLHELLLLLACLVPPEGCCIQQLPPSIIHISWEELHACHTQGQISRGISSEHSSQASNSPANIVAKHRCLAGCNLCTMYDNTNAVPEEEQDALCCTQLI